MTFSHFKHMLGQERTSYFPIFLLRFAFEQLLGRLHARLLGWQSGYIGRGGRVIGSRAIRVGARAHINRHAWIEAVHGFRGQVFQPAIRIGRGFSASDRLHISCAQHIEIGDDCLLGSGVYISDHNHGAYRGAAQSHPDQAPVDRTLLCSGEVRIGSRVWIGDNVVIVGPLTIGDGAIIGANSVVKHPVPANTIVAGSPARVLRKFNQVNGSWDANDG